MPLVAARATRFAGKAGTSAPISRPLGLPSVSSPRPQSTVKTLAERGLEENRAARKRLLAMAAILFLALLVIGAIGLMVQGDIGDGAIVLLIIGMIIVAARRPFKRMPPPERRRSRLIATATVLVGWFAAGNLLWEWDGASYGVAGVVAAYALYRAAKLPSEEPPESASGADPVGEDESTTSSFASR